MLICLGRCVSATGDVITAIAAGSKADVDRAADIAQKVFKTSWGFKVNGSERGKMLWKLADLMEAHLPEFAALDALANGQLLWLLGPR